MTRSHPPMPPAVTPAAAENPLLVASTLPFQAPPFDKIKDADYQPAFEEGMQQHLAEIETIADNPAAPTFDNTIVAMERSGALLTRVAKVFFGLAQANTNDDAAEDPGRTSRPSSPRTRTRSISIRSSSRA